MPVAPPPPPLPDRVQVRPKASGLTAVKVKAATVVDLVDGRKVPAMAGDWLITNGPSVLTVVPQATLDQQYEIVQEGGLTVDPAIRHLLQDVLGVGSTASGHTLLEAVHRLSRLSIYGCSISFSPGQLEELKFRATKRGRSVQEEIDAVVARIRDELFWKGPGNTDASA